MIAMCSPAPVGWARSRRCAGGRVRYGLSAIRKARRYQPVGSGCTPIVPSTVSLSQTFLPYRGKTRSSEALCGDTGPRLVGGPGPSGGRDAARPRTAGRSEPGSGGCPSKRRSRRLSAISLPPKTAYPGPSSDAYEYLRGAAWCCRHRVCGAHRNGTDAAGGNYEEAIHR